MFQNKPPTDVRVPLPIVRCRPKRPLEVTFVCKDFRGVETHHMNGKTFRHLDVRECPGCQRNLAPRWQGFIIVSAPHGENFAILQFTPLVANVLLNHAHESKGLVGLNVRLTRLGPAANAPLNCHVMGRTAEVREWSVEQLESIVTRIFSGGEGPKIDKKV